MASTFSFGIWDNWESYVEAAEEGLRLDENMNLTDNPIYIGNDEKTEVKLGSSPDFFEVDTSKPLLPQIQFENLTQFVNPQVIQEYRILFENLKTKMDMGGVTERDRLIPSSNPIGIFSFGLASPTLYRKVEFYVPDLDILVDGLDVTKEESNDIQKFYTIVEGKQYRVWRQQDGTQDILRNVPNAKRIMLEDGMYISDPSSGVGADGTEYRLKFATKTKKIYLEKPKQTGEAQYVDLFVVSGANGDKNSAAMFAKVAPILMLAEKLEEAGVRTRIYAWDGIDGINQKGIKIAAYAFVVKEYGEKTDVDRIATLTNDPRLFRGKIFAYESGLMRKQSGIWKSGGSTVVLYSGDSFDKTFVSFRNYIMQRKNNGLFNTKVKEKSLMMVSNLPNPSNTFKNNENDIVNEFYRISDITELILAKEPEKAVRRMVERDRKRGISDVAIKNNMKNSVKRAFRIVTPSMDDTYFDSEEEAQRLDEREKRILYAIDTILP